MDPVKIADGHDGLSKSSFDVFNPEYNFHLDGYKEKDWVAT
jgi:hypothetical protein